MKITFKNVGQGDSVILEWTKNGERRLGIVDCNLYQKTNPTIQHLQKVGCTKIDFIILSHPHEDHFSGMLELLEFCEIHNIPITTFAHTAAALHPRYLNYANINSSDLVLLDKILFKAKALFNKKMIRLLGSIAQNTTITLNQDFTLKALSPSIIELEKFTKEIDSNDQDYAKCSKAANYLSSVLKIYNKEGACLLTSDTEKSTLKRLKLRHIAEFETAFSIVQIPHHGSKNNHYPLFWSNLKRIPNCIAAVSVADGKYGHPNNNVISDFNSWDYETYSTNRLKVFSKPSQIKTSLILDKISNVIDSEGDLIFEVI